MAWSKDGGLGAEFALVDFGADDLRADGYGIGFEPEPYRLEYTLQTTTRFVTSRVAVVTRGDGWVRQLDLYRASSGT